PLAGTARPIHSNAMIDITPDPVFLRLFGFPIYWYGLAYAIGLAAVYLVIVREAQFRGLDETLIGTGMIVVAVAALVGGRLYHVIDQWHLYQNDPITAVLPLARDPATGQLVFAGFTGLGVPGGIVTGTLAGIFYVRRNHQSFFRWADVVAPGLFVMQAIGRWGNFFNQELYGPPTTLPWGIKIDCAHRIPDFPCSAYPDGTHFQPLFLYESISGIVGALVLIWLARRWSSRLVPGDLLLIFFAWYGVTRFGLETLRHDNWTFFGVPMAQIVTLGFILVGVVGLWYRHGPGRPAETAADLLPATGPDELDDEDAFWADDDDFAARAEVDSTDAAEATTGAAGATAGAAGATAGGAGAADEASGHDAPDDDAGSRPAPSMP
ncbi:MAG TPA: prolipoprotein diacylglyceryl transferase, partial [Candidatus Limnocylindrales bacterium]|nr:prolipoprotein diacylglyceryl transferase [Candidatus Limnocylindrales bacterium]